MTRYFDLLITKLTDKIDGPEKGRVDVTQWFNFTAFDIVSRLTLDDCFNLLEQERFNFWTEQVFKGIKLLRYLRVIRRYPVLWHAFDAIFKAFPKLQGVRNAHMDFAIGQSEVAVLLSQCTKVNELTNVTIPMRRSPNHTTPCPTKPP
jgi:hypothetical protein